VSSTVGEKSTDKHGADMEDLFIAFWIFEGFLFLAWLLSILGGGKRTSRSKRFGFALFATWLVVFVVGILWSVIRVVFGILQA
jgi:hypothetical protein